MNVNKIDLDKFVKFVDSAVENPLNDSQNRRVTGYLRRKGFGTLGELFDSNEKISEKFRGRTLLVRAILDGDIAVVAALLRKGVDINVKVHGKYPLQIAKEDGLVAIANLLKQFGAKESDGTTGPLSSPPVNPRYLYVENREASIPNYSDELAKKNWLEQVRLFDFSHLFARAAAEAYNYNREVKAKQQLLQREEQQVRSYHYNTTHNYTYNESKKLNYL